MEPEPFEISCRTEAGVTAGYLVTWTGEPGPAVSTSVAVLSDGDGGLTFVATGEPKAVTVVDDS